MMRLNKFLATLTVCISSLLLSGCQSVMLDPKGLIATEEKNIMVISVLLMLIVVIPVIAMALIFAWRYRENRPLAKYTPNWSHSVLLEAIWWFVPCMIILILSTITWISTHKLDPYRPIHLGNKKPITIQVIALEWKWLFLYPEQQIASVNFVQFPVDTPIKFIITSDGPMNSFQIPQLAGQIYAMSGMQTKLHMVANATGDFKGMSANFSGEGFSDMKFTARVSTDEAFSQWVDQVKRTSEVLTYNTFVTLSKPSIHQAMQTYTTKTSDYFNSVVMKYMNPAKNNSELCKRTFKNAAKS